MTVEERPAEKFPLELQYSAYHRVGAESQRLCRVGACGLWQMMPSQRGSGTFEVNSLVD